MLKALSYIGNKFNDLNIVWGAGGSVLLSHFGLLNTLNDISIFVDVNDIIKIDEMFKDMSNEIDFFLIRLDIKSIKDVILFISFLSIKVSFPNILIYNIDFIYQ